MNIKLNRKRIVFLEDSSAWGGVEKWILSIAQGLKDYGRDVAIATSLNGELGKRASQLSIEVFPIELKGRLRILNPFNLYKFSYYLKKNKVEILFLNGSKEFKFGGLAAYFAKTEKVLYRRGAALPIANKWFNRFILNNALHLIITNSQSSKKQILEHGKGWLDENKIRVIYNGVDLKVFNPEGEIAPIREEFSVPNDCALITCIGRLTKQKGYPFIIEAISRVYKSFDKFHVVIVGEGELRDELEFMVKDKGLNNVISFAGFRKEIASILRACDFMLHAPLWEGAPNVILEAMACGKPVVSWDVDGIGELMPASGAGYLSKAKDVETLAGNIMKMLEDVFSSRAKDMAKNAREKAEKYFSLEKMIKEYVNLIDENHER